MRSSVPLLLLTTHPQAALSVAHSAGQGETRQREETAGPVAGAAGAASSSGPLMDMKTASCAKGPSARSHTREHTAALTAIFHMAGTQAAG